MELGLDQIPFVGARIDETTEHWSFFEEDV